MTGMDDLETSTLKAQLEELERRWRADAEQARSGAGSMSYQEGYADALDRCVQALKGLEDQW